MSGASAPAGPVLPLLTLQGIRRIYGSGESEVRALDGIDLDVPAGDFVCLMGPSGSGKSTALNVLGCLDAPTSGSYRFRGVEVAGLDNRGRALLRRYYLGFVFQGFNLLSRTTALENVELPLVYQGIPARERRRRAQRALLDVGMADRMEHEPNELSGGQQQRVAIARALVTEPQVLLADEPTGNLDTPRSHEILRLLSRLNVERGLTILMVSHEPDMAAYARRLVRFRDGKVESIQVNPDPSAARGVGIGSAAPC
jgi:putative ABC transport system ATP-binding protein